MIVLSNRIYFKYRDIDEIKNKLTYKYTKNQEQLTFCDVKVISPFVASIPINRTNVLEYTEIKDKRVKIDVEYPEPKIKLRDNQPEVYKQANDSCILNLPTGYGKTFILLHILAKFNQKALIVVDRIGLLKQWKEEIYKLFGFYPGIIQGKNKTITDNIIHVGTIQTLSKINCINRFGLVAVDECHHAPSKTFLEFLNNNKARYKFGLTATMNRTDGLGKVIPDYIGKVIKPLDDTQLVPKVYIVEPDISLYYINKWSDTLDKLYSNEQYIELVVELAEACIENGYRTLVLCDRVDFLKTCGAILDDKCTVVTGTMGDKEEIRKYNCIFGSISIFKEGIDIPELDTLILASPISSEPLLEQCIGRITRPVKDECRVFDIKLKRADTQFRNRASVYIKKGCKINYLT